MRHTMFWWWCRYGWYRGRAFVHYRIKERMPWRVAWEDSHFQAVAIFNGIRVREILRDRAEARATGYSEEHSCPGCGGFARCFCAPDDPTDLAS
jgi:hypothetical protein